MRASSLCFQAAVLFVLAGMVWGLQMAISDDHSAFPAHAHLNLLGWVSLFLFGIYYRLHASLDESRVALIQVWIWIIGTVVTAIGVALVYRGHQEADPIAAVGSFVVLAAMLMFAWLVYRCELSCHGRKVEDSLLVLDFSQCPVRGVYPSRAVHLGDEMAEVFRVSLGGLDDERTPAAHRSSIMPAE